MSLLRSIRQTNSIRSVAPRSTTTPAIAIAGRRFAHGDYGSGDANANEAANQTQRDNEHPGPPPPKTAQQSSGSDSQPSQTTSNGAKPKILSDSPPAQGEESEEAAKHNREMSQRYDRAQEGVKNEDAEKDKVPKGFWSGR